MNGATSLSATTARHRSASISRKVSRSRTTSSPSSSAPTKAAIGNCPGSKSLSIVRIRTPKSSFTNHER